jgi:tetratricopeptide (TPR) repeat protein
MQIPNLFLIGLSFYLFGGNKDFELKSSNKTSKPLIKAAFISLFIIGIIFSIYISFSVYRSMVHQKEFLGLAASNSEDFSEEEIYEIDSWIPNIDVFTMPIDALKANLLIRIEQYDSVPKFIENAIKANPKIGYAELVKSIYLLKTDKKLDSSYYYAKRAYEILPSQFNHFDHYLNMIEIFRDTISLTEVYEALKNNYDEEKYQKYIQVSSRINNNISLSGIDLINKLKVNNPMNSINQALEIMGQIGRKNVDLGFNFENLAIKEYEKNNFENAAKLFEKASEYNSLEVSYFENAANCYMKINENQKAIAILEKTIINLQPKTGKAEYLLGIIYLDLKEKNLGCSYLNQARGKGFVFNDALLNQFCNEE